MRSAWRRLAVIGLASMRSSSSPAVAAMIGLDEGGSTTESSVHSADRRRRFDGRLLGDDQAQRPCERRRGNDRGPAPRHDDVDALRPVRRAEPEESLRDRWALFRPVRDPERPGQHEHDAAAGGSHDHRGRLGAPRRSVGSRFRRGDRGGCRVAGLEGDRLRPPRDRRPQGSLLRQLQQRRSGRADRPGRSRLHHGLESEQATGPGDERRPHGQQREALRTGLQRRPQAAHSTTAHIPRSARRRARGMGRPRPRPSSSSTPRTRTSTRS